MEPEEQAEWADVSAHADLVAERDHARTEASTLRNKLAAAEADLAEAREHLVKGVLLQIRVANRIAPLCSTDELVWHVAEKFGVRL